MEWSVHKIWTILSLWIQQQSLTWTTASDKRRLNLICTFLVTMSVMSILLLMNTCMTYNMGTNDTVDFDKYLNSKGKSNGFSPSFDFADNTVNSTSDIMFYSTDSNGSCQNVIACIVPNDFGTNIQFQRNYTGNKGVDKINLDYWMGKLCNGMPERVTNGKRNSNNRLYNITFSCDEVFSDDRLGTGNVMLAFYTFRRIAQQIGNIDVSMTCNDANATKDRLILPWLMGSFPRTYWYDRKEGTNTLAMEPLFSSNQSCGYIQRPVFLANPCESYRYNPMDMYQDFIFELRRMAIALVGTQDKDHPAYVWASNNLWQNNDTFVKVKNSQMQLPTPQKYDLPLLSNIEIDDVVFHFRCGDIMSTDNKKYGFMKFSSYSKHLEREQHYQNQFRSIGIVTQPFSGSIQGRDKDQSSAVDDKCRMIVSAFKHFLEEQNHTYSVFNEYGTTKTENVCVTIRNSKDDFITTSYARMIMAKHVVVTGNSSFSSFAAQASFSKKIFIPYPMDVSKTELVPSVQLINEEFINAVDCQKLWLKDNGTTLIQTLMS
jgi:hypothetical protein